MSVLLSWSSGKDSAWSLHALKQQKVPVSALVTSFSEDVDRVAMHATRRELVHRQAETIGLPLIEVFLPRPCTNQDYETFMGAAIRQAIDERGIEAMAFGDLYLADIRAYREKQLEPFGIEPVFPLWGLDTTALAGEMIDTGLDATVCCIDPRVMPRELVGRRFDHEFLHELPAGVDPCGENGEFHTFCHAGPMFSHSLMVRSAEVVEREGFVFSDILPG